MFSSCAALEGCQDCVTEDKGCLPLALNGLCSGAVESHIADTLIDIVSDIQTEFACREACVAVDGCNFYTYHDLSNSAFHKTCFLLSGLQEPIKPCESCRTGPTDCLNKNACIFTLNGQNSSSKMMLTETSTSHTLDALLLGRAKRLAFCLLEGVELGDMAEMEVEAAVILQTRNK